VPGSDISPYLVAADVMITDHSSAGFEYLLLDRPVVRIHVPELLTLATVQPEYVELLCDAAISAHDVPQTVAAVERALENPAERSAARRRVAADLFYRPGGATARCVEALYELMELDPAAAVETAMHVPHRFSGSLER
jgi:CDP-glycerol glycerophosphotransferase